MLARTVAPTADFHELARYLLNGKTGTPSPDRVAWSLPHNLPTDDVLFAARIMAACAGLNRRATKPVYHLVIGWAPHEKPTLAQMQTIALETLVRAGLGEHQAFIMGHGDTEHDHLHMMINRVHPDTGRTWKPSHDWRLFDRIMRELADEHGFQFVPSHAFNPDETRHQRTKPNRNATYAAKRGANTHRPQWSTAEAEAYGARLSERLDAASTWEDLVALVASDGLLLEAKGHGHVIGNADAYVKLSALGLARTAKSYATPEPADDEPPPPPYLRFSDHQLALRQPDIARVFAIAATYAELEQGLRYYGLHLEPVGKSGLLLTDGLHQISLAQLQLDSPRCDLLAQWFEPEVIDRLRKLTRPDLKPDENVEAVPTPSPPARDQTCSHWQRHHREHHVRWPCLDRPTGHAAPWLDEIDIARALAAWGLVDADDVRRAINNAIAEREAAREEFMPLMQRLLTTTNCKPAPARRLPPPTPSQGWPRPQPRPRNR